MKQWRCGVGVVALCLLIGGLSGCHREGIRDSGTREYQQLVFRQEGSTSCQNGYRIPFKEHILESIGAEHGQQYSVSPVSDWGEKEGVYFSGSAIKPPYAGGVPPVLLEPGDSVTDFAAGTFTLLEVHPAAPLSIGEGDWAILCFVPRPGFEVDPRIIDYNASQ